MIKRVIVWCWSTKMRGKKDTMVIFRFLYVSMCMCVKRSKSHHIPHHKKHLSSTIVCVCVCVLDVLPKARQWSGCTAHYGHTHIHGGDGHSDCDSCWWSNILRESLVGRCPQAHTRSMSGERWFSRHSFGYSQWINCLSIFILSFHLGYFYIFFHIN